MKITLLLYCHKAGYAVTHTWNGTEWVCSVCKQAARKKVSYDL